jgi:hypothetical protein
VERAGVNYDPFDLGEHDGKLRFDPLDTTPTRRRYGPRPLAGSIFDRPHHRRMRTMNPIPFGAPEDAHDTSMDNYLTECACCGDEMWRDDLDEHLMCDECVAIGEHAAIINTTMETRREAIADAAYHDAKGV